jgi:uncharacterized protein YjgD (DUF1641 family)
MEQEMPDINQTVLELNQKIDALTSQVAYLIEQAQISERGRQERSDLMENMMPVAKDAMRLASDQFEEIQDYLKAEDLLRFVKKLARHRPQMEMLLDQMDGVTDLVNIMNPIAKEGFDKLTSVLTELEQKGYFAVTRGGVRLMDKVVTSISEEDLNQMSDNVGLVLNLVKGMGQPEILNFMNSTFEAAEIEVKKPVNNSMFAIMGQLNDPDVRRGLALTLRVLRVVGAQAETK